MTRTHSCAKATSSAPSCARCASATASRWKSCRRAASQSDAADGAFGVVPEHDREQQARALARRARAAGEGLPARARAGFSTRTRRSRAERAEDRRGGAARMPLEPVVPVLEGRCCRRRSRSCWRRPGTTGRQFAHLLIRSHQEMSRNDFPGSRARRRERRRARVSRSTRRGPAARSASGTASTIRWFERKPVLARDNDARSAQHAALLLRGAAHGLPEQARCSADPARLKFDLASHIGAQGAARRRRAEVRARHRRRDGRQPRQRLEPRAGMNAQDVLHRLARLRVQLLRGRPALPEDAVPALPHARALPHRGRRKLELTPAVMMRRMTKVSPYPHWHFFDAYPPGLSARGVSRQRHSAAVGQHRAGDRPVPALGGVPHDRRSPQRERLADLGAAATATAGCSTAATPCARRTWRAIRTCSRSASISRRRSSRTAPTTQRIADAIGEECLRHKAGSAHIAEGRGRGDPRGGEHAEHRVGGGCA